MYMKKVIFLFTWFFVCSGGVRAQQAVYTYSYDASGNRIRRTVLVLSRDDASGNMDGDGKVAAMLDDGGVRVYPNPTKGVVTIEITDGGDVSGYRLSDAQGRMMLGGRCGSPSLRIDLSGRPTGTYLLEVVLGTERRHYQIIKQ